MGIKNGGITWVFVPRWRKGGYAGFLPDKRIDIKRLRSGQKLS